MPQKYYKQKQTGNANYARNNRTHYICMPSISKKQYIKTHGSVCVCAQTQFKTRKETGVKLDNDHCLTDWTISNDIPYIVIRGNGKGTCMFIKFEISGYKCYKEEAEKSLKYKGFTTEFKRMLTVKTNVVPIIIKKGNSYHI
jgi:hypothetical protein